MDNKKTRIFRSSKQANYSVINNEVLRREDLSWKAKGIMCYVLSLPDDWEIYLEEIQKHSTDGMKGFRSGWNELKEKGYVSRYPVYRNGKISEWRTEVTESIDIISNSLLSQNLQVGSVDVENLLVEKDKLLSTNNTNYLSKLNTDSNNISSTDDSQSLNNRFELIWKQYPKGRKQGKDKSFKAYQRAIKDGVTDEMILKGLSDYKKQIEIQRTELQFIKQAVTWFTNKSWNDEYVTTSKNQMVFNQATAIDMEQYEYGNNSNQQTIDDLPY